jgi:hypothetical protein
MGNLIHQMKSLLLEMPIPVYRACNFLKGVDSDPMSKQLYHFQPILKISVFSLGVSMVFSPFKNLT